MTENETTLKRFPHSRTSYLRRGAVGVCFLIMLAVLTGYVSQCSVNVAEEIPMYYKTPTFEIYPEEEISPRRQIPKPEPFLPKVAIIIDDMGYDVDIAEKFLSLDTTLTFSIFPHSPFQKEIMSRARAKEMDIMLHLPMEPKEYPLVDPGPGALLTTMPPEKLISQLRENLDALPFIKGVNNHMGSKMTAVSTHIYQILSVLKKRNLFFIDSFTTADSRCKSSARLLQIPFAQRDVFLDHVQDPDSIRKQLNRLVRIANYYGEAIGIGHPYTVTYEVFREMFPELKKKVRLVPASEVVHTIG
ncbi:divergent polysaccharide deacetylase family protein [Desulfobacterales bacterium HSG2]|nr:divergent polysaccharide deacetylase family protein [Desulfobacterales bacterium HSG2]